MYVRRIARIAFPAAAAALIATAPVHAQSAAVQDTLVQAQITLAQAQIVLVQAQIPLPHTRPSPILERSPLQPLPRSARTAFTHTSAGDGLLESLDDPAVLQDRGGWSALRVAKWTTTGLSAGAAVYGVLNNRRADDEYEQLEEVCAAEASRCDQRLPGGAYADAQVEAQYQDVRTLDRRARTGLIAGQIGFAASVVLFVLDLRNNDGPDNIPYDPRTIDIMPARDGGMSLRVNLQR